VLNFCLCVYNKQIKQTNTMGVPNIGNRTRYDNTYIIPFIMYENNEKNLQIRHVGTGDIGCIEPVNFPC